MLGVCVFIHSSPVHLRRYEAFLETSKAECPVHPLFVLAYSRVRIEHNKPLRASLLRDWASQFPEWARDFRTSPNGWLTAEEEQWLVREGARWRGREREGERETLLHRTCSHFGPLRTACGVSHFVARLPATAALCPLVQCRMNTKRGGQRCGLS